MNCNKLKQKLAAAIESHQSLDSRELEAHLAECADCRMQLEEHILLEQAIDVWRESTPPIDIVDAVMAELAFDDNDPIETRHSAKPFSLSAEPQQPGTAPRNLPTGQIRRQRLFRSVVSAGVVAATVLIAVFTLHTSDSTTDKFSPPLHVENPTSGTEKTETIAGSVLETDNDLDTLLLDAGGAYLVLARDAANVVADITLSLPSPIRDSSTSGRSQTVDAPAATGWVGAFEDEFAPVGRNLGQAFDFLIEVVPTEESPAT